MSKSSTTDEQNALLLRKLDGRAERYCNLRTFPNTNAREHAHSGYVNGYRDALTKFVDLLTDLGKRCLCTRNTVGFDYGETHPKLGKPGIGKRWLSPGAVIENVLLAEHAQSALEESRAAEKEGPAFCGDEDCPTPGIHFVDAHPKENKCSTGSTGSSSPQSSPGTPTTSSGQSSEVARTAVAKPECTGMSAAWCPNCGDCECGRHDGNLDSEDCPLHGTDSEHAEEPRELWQGMELVPAKMVIELEAKLSSRPDYQAVVDAATRLVNAYDIMGVFGRMGDRSDVAENLVKAVRNLGGKNE